MSPNNYVQAVFGIRVIQASYIHFIALNRSWWTCANINNHRTYALAIY